ncbi:methyltransferase [Sphingosinicellaceae bacterium]|nr:methyltransferase [Sphingosinicellaceae bacterium]
MTDRYDAHALLDLLGALDATDYRFVAPTPATHARIMARSAVGYDLRDLLGWSRTVPPGDLPAAVRDILQRTGAITETAQGWRSSIRVSRLRGRLFLHSAYPTSDGDAVFFGPDSYRFADFIVEELARDSLCRTVIDVGTGSGVGLTVAASLALPARLVMTDINGAALELARVNARYANLEVEALEGDALAGFKAPIDLALANPPFIIDEAKRAYRHGGDRLGSQLSLDMAAAIAARLAPGGRLLLYTGTAIVGGIDGFRADLAEAMAAAGCTLRYRELDPDIFGEELDRPVYARAGVERIAAVGAIATRPG